MKHPRKYPQGGTKRPGSGPGASDLVAAAEDPLLRQIIKEAREQAVGIVAAARAEGVKLLDRARADAAREQRRRETLSARPATPIHSSEITARAFRSAFKGLDPSAVRDWLNVVEASHGALEDELDRLRSGWDEMLIATARLRNAPTPATWSAADRWETLAPLLTGSRPQTYLAAAGAGSMRDPSAAGIRGRRRTRAALADAGVQLARMRHGTALVMRSNELLRSELLRSLSTTSAPWT